MAGGLAEKTEPSSAYWGRGIRRYHALTEGFLVGETFRGGGRPASPLDENLRNLKGEWSLLVSPAAWALRWRSAQSTGTVPHRDGSQGKEEEGGSGFLVSPWGGGPGGTKNRGQKCLNPSPPGGGPSEYKRPPPYPSLGGGYRFQKDAGVGGVTLHGGLSLPIPPRTEGTAFGVTDPDSGGGEAAGWTNRVGPDPVES